MMPAMIGRGAVSRGGANPPLISATNAIQTSGIGERVAWRRRAILVPAQQRLTGHSATTGQPAPLAYVLPRTNEPG